MNYLVPFLLTYYLFTACGQSTTNGNKNRKLEPKSTTIADKKNSNDSIFLNYAVNFASNQIYMGELVISKGNSSSVRELARMIIKAQQLYLISVKELAASKKIEISYIQKANETIDYNKLNQTNEVKFNSTYAHNLATELLNCIHIFEKAAVESNDMEIKNWTNDALAELRIQYQNTLNYQKNYIQPFTDSINN
jgi:predicted outer membrane protein